MEARCSTCGYRSDALGFFRRARGGLLDRPKTVCEGCNPYQPGLFERRLFRDVFVLQILWLLMIAWFSLGLIDDPLSLFLMVQAALLTFVVRIAVHEAGHALAAHALGARVLRVTIGYGPPWRLFRLGGVPIDVRRYAFMGGLTQLTWPGGFTARWRSIVVLLGGPGANAVAAGLAFWAASACPEGWPTTFAQPVLGGLGLSQAFTAIHNLLPSTSRLTGLPTDGRQALALLAPSASNLDPATKALLQGQAHLVEGRFKPAADAFWEAAQLKPDATYAFAMTLHCLNHAEGDAATMAFFHAHRLAFEESMTTTDEIHRTAIPYLQANIAMPALTSDLPLADTYSRAALDALPEAAAMLGTRGAYLAACGAAAAGRELLIQAVRGSVTGNDRGVFADALANVDRGLGDTASAEAFESLGRYARAI